MAFSYGDGADFGSVFGATDPMGMSPALGRLLASNPEALIPQLAAAGIAPPAGPQMAQMGTEWVPGMPMPAPSPVAPPAPQTPQAPPPTQGALPDILAPLVPSGGTENVPLPQPRPSAESDTTTEASAKQNANPVKGLLDSLAGVKAPPAPPQPQVRPHTDRSAAFPHGSPIAALLANIMSGQSPAATGILRLNQAIGGRNG